MSQAAGLAIVMDKASDEKMVNVLIAYRQKVVAIVKECFGLDQSFQQAQSQAFEFFINKRENKPAEMMGAFRSSFP
jgi:cullin-4